MSAALPPLCRCCGKPLKKITTSVNFNCDPEPIEGQASGRTGHAACPKTKAEAQTYINHGQVVSVRRGKRCDYLTEIVQPASGYGPPVYNAGKAYRKTRQTDEEIIREVSVWDGKSYQRHFCTNDCAITFAHTFAAAGHQTKKHAEAREAQRAKAGGAA